MKQYQKGEFCKAMSCHKTSISYIGYLPCSQECPYTAYDFHNWIIERGGRIFFGDDCYPLTINPNATFEERDEE